MKHTCKDCKKKYACLMRSTALFLLFIQTGRDKELTDEVRDNFSFCTNCEYWEALKENEVPSEKEVSDE